MGMLYNRGRRMAKMEIWVTCHRRFILLLLILLFFAPCILAQKLELVIETGHSDKVDAVAFSPDGRIVASASEDHTIILWDVASGQELRSLRGHAEKVLSLAFSPNGAMLASGSWDGTVKVWEAESGRELHNFKFHSMAVFAVGFSRDSKILASGSSDATLNLWDLAANDELASVLAGNEVESIAFSPDGRSLATGEGNKLIKIWDVATGKLIRTLTGHTGWVAAIGFSADGKWLVSGSADNTIKIWDAASGAEIKTLTGHKDLVHSVEFSSDGRTVISGGWDKTIKIWDVNSGREIRSISEHTDRVNSVAFSPDGKEFISGSSDKTVKLWNFATGNEVKTFAGHLDPITSMSLSSNGKTIAAGHLGSTITLDDLSNPRQTKTLGGHTDAVEGVEFSPDGKTLASVSGRRLFNDEKNIKLWDVASGRELRNLTGHITSVRAIAFSPDGKLVASGSRDTTIKIWDVESGRELRTLTGHEGWIHSVAFSPDGKLLASACGGPLPDEDNTVRLWDVATGRELHKGTTHGGVVWAVQFSPDGKTYASSSSDKTIKLWDTASGSELRTLRGSTSPIISLGFSPDGKRLVSAGRDGMIKVWDAASGHELLSLTGHTSDVTSVAFREDGQMIISGSEDGSIRFWDAASGKQLAALFTIGETDWAVVDPEGRFDASPGGMKLIHWVVGFEPIDLAQLKERYYEPGMLQKVLGYNQEARRDVEAFHDVKLFPDATVEEPSKDSRKLIVNLKNRGGGIGRVQVFVNDKELVADARGPKISPAAAEASLTVNLAGAPLRPGESNEIRVVTWNQDGYLSSRGAKLTWQPSGERDHRPPEMFAIVAGISEYSSPELSLHFASKDAANMARAIDLGARRLLGADHVHLTVLTSPAEGGSLLATKENIRKAFDAARKAGPDDILVVYLAGHGVAIQDTYAYPGEDARTLDLSDPAIRAQTSVTSEELSEWMKKVPALHQVMIIDTCAAGAAAVKLVEKRDVPGDQVRAIERLKDRTGVYVLMGSAADSVSYEASQYGQGLLTYALLRGMKGAALRDDEYVDVGKLFHDAEDEVPELARGIGGIQQPRIASPGGASFDIGKLLAEDRQNIPLAAVKPILLRPQFLNSKLHRDNLGLSGALRNRLRDASYASARSGAGGAAAVFVDQDDFPGAINPSGDYVAEATQMKVTMVLTRDDKEIAQIVVEGTSNDLNALAGRLAAEIDRVLAGLRGH